MLSFFDLLFKDFYLSRINRNFKFSKRHGPFRNCRQGYGDGKTQQRPYQDTLCQLLLFGLLEAKNGIGGHKESNTRRLTNENKQKNEAPLQPLFPSLSLNLGPYASF
jgi:hypothetical protein